MTMTKGVINIVEILILIVLFLGAAALFGTYLLSSTNKQSQALESRQEQVIISLNPPVKVLGVIQAKVDLDNDNKEDIVPVACVQETEGGSWWLSDIRLKAGTLGNTLISINTGSKTAELLRNVWNVGNSSLALNFTYAITNVTYSPLVPKNMKGENVTNVLLICRNSTTIINVTAATFECNKENIEGTLNDYKDNICNNSDEIIEVYNLVEFLPSGTTAPVVVYPIYSSIGWDYSSYTVSIYFSKSIVPDPKDIPTRKYAGETVKANEVLKVLSTTGNLTSFRDVFKADCEECTFYVG
ncbi:hypothetical protein EYM_00090 [Ignicoccus islandicus DSM 13165]|uniref:Uncharacterized protein n=1 Tax=Ignicoccus islandicus DSM 13165 TaxID=940295 RepID=A0A0U3G198_9CREN|nr:hypothetical protein [Ignicoccus islandicus]ALU12092.1 hypothetical protein EYM_00090 [Ignicoccus islandicus DSM 13165]